MSTGTASGKISKSIGYHIGDCPVTLAEVMATREAIRPTRPWGILRINLASDSQITIKAILGESPAWTLVGYLVEDTQSLTRNFSTIIFCLCNRHAKFASRCFDKQGIILSPEVIILVKFCEFLVKLK